MHTHTHNVCGPTAVGVCVGVWTKAALAHTGEGCAKSIELISRFVVVGRATVVVVEANDPKLR